MARSSRFSRWRDSVRWPLTGPRACGANPVKLTVDGPRFRVHVEMGRPRKANDAGIRSAGALDAVPARDETRTDQRPPHQASDDVRASSISSDNGPQPKRTDTQKLRPHDPAAGFWDILEPTEREALRSVASCRTLAAAERAARCPRTT